MIHRIICLAALFITMQSLSGQENEQRDGNFVGVGISYGVNFPGGDLADRFGQSFQAGVSVDWFNGNFNGAFGLETYMLFGSKVREDVLSSLRRPGETAGPGPILGFDGNYVDAYLRFRGNYTGLYFKKIILSRSDNPRAGLAVSAGAGLMNHKVRIIVDSNNAPHLEGEYLKGYDRYSMGPAFKQGVSYTHVGKSRAVNYSFAFNIFEGITKNQRPINFDTREKEEGTRLDLIYSFHFKWYIPLIDMRAPEEIYY